MIAHKKIVLLLQEIIHLVINNRSFWTTSGSKSKMIFKSNHNQQQATL